MNSPLLTLLSFKFKITTHRNKGWSVVTVIEVYIHNTLSWLLGYLIVVTHCNCRIAVIML